MSSKRVKMTVEMDVTVPQGLALQAMFKHWNRLASWGSSRMVAFYVDGDGNFKPKCNVTFAEEMPELTEDLEKAAMVMDEHQNPQRRIDFDFDSIAWKLSARAVEQSRRRAARAEGFASDEDVAKLIVSDASMYQLEKAVEDPPEANDKLKSAMSKFRDEQPDTLASYVKKWPDETYAEDEKKEDHPKDKE